MRPFQFIHQCCTVWYCCIAYFFEAEKLLTQVGRQAWGTCEAELHGVFLGVVAVMLAVCRVLWFFVWLKGCGILCSFK